MKIALLLPKQPILTVLVLQTCFHGLSHTVRTHQTQDGPAKMPGPPYSMQCCSSQYFTQYFELLSDSTSAHRWLSPCSPRRPPEAPCATGGQSTPLSRPPPAFRTPIPRSGTPHYRSAWFADRHGRWPLPPAPRRSAPHAPRGGSTHPRELIERRSVQPCLKFDVKPVNILAMVSRGNGRLAHLD